MNISCTKCFTTILLEGPIAPTGSKVTCAGCGSAFTIYPSKTVIGDFVKYVMNNSDISARACSMIRGHVRDVDIFLRSSRKDFLGFRNCGQKITSELIKFQRELRKKLDYGAGQNESEDEIVESHHKAVIAFLSRDVFFKEVLDSKLSQAYFKALRHHGIDTLEKVLALSYQDVLRIKHVGRKTLRLFRGFQEICSEIVKTIVDSEVLRFKDFKWVVRQDQTIRNILSHGKNMDVDAPFFSLSQWILENSRHSERNRDVFMCRMGMLGEPGMTYDNIGIRYNISKGRVQQIILKVQSNGRRPLQRIRLDPLIAKAAEIVKTGGGKTGLSELTESLLNCGPQGELLKHAEPFVDYLKSFPEWEEVMR